MGLILRVHAAAVIVFLVTVATSQVAIAQPSRAKLEKTAPSAPIFIENMGQFDPKVKFQVKVGSQLAWLTSEGIVFDASRQASGGRTQSESRTVDRLVFSEDFAGTQCCSKLEGKNPQPGVYNYFQSSDPKDWHTNVRSFSEVVYHDVWPGVDLRIYGVAAK